MKYHTLGLLLSATIVGVALIFLSTGCALPVRKAQPIVEPVVVETKGRIDAPALIEAANAADCELGTLLYKEGKKDSKIMIQCALGQPLPPAIRKGF